MSRAYAVDTSVAVAALDGGHTSHAAAREAALKYRPALAGHACFESVSVLSRLPGLMAVSADEAVRALNLAFPVRLHLSPEQEDELWQRIAVLGIRGGMIYDAMVGESARTNDRVLLTRDRRAKATYDLLGVAHEFVGA